MIDIAPKPTPSISISIDNDTIPLGETDLAIHELQSVAREGIALGAGTAAVLLQIAHPLVGQGVADHSTFASRTISRTEYTQMYIFAMIFGTDEEKAAMKAWVDKAHARVKGEAQVQVQNSGEYRNEAYDAMNPTLQLWVAATIYASMVGMYEKVYGELPPLKAELVYQAYACMGTSLQVPREMWPADRRAFKVYWDDVVQNQLYVTEDARGVLDELFHPKGLPLWARPIAWTLLPIVRPLTVEQLPVNVREGFGLKSTMATRAIAGLFMSTVMVTYPVTPGFIRHWQKTYSLRLMRKRMKNRGGKLLKL
ncbi:oxygenase MpaB family protein [Aspergillus puulaauensis]|uniref:ER-bound oxygenase mpaB/mpaB'/Rubber oxygenase catalytic domain-containing protein n=1 Tax=Aspergillus puulaauensis TaxID=1220207 RepID=A0A7R8AT11_9EURO|nr:uncharacterized protein APUU_61333S [Aspergillus puulaauensis]BCS28285.1 hypothetical protein APUU_61333S [Aspergillus puulaauensis]